jgi:hypothetical protein
MTDHVDPDLNSGRVPQPGGVVMPVPTMSLASDDQDTAAVDLVMDVGVLIEAAPVEEDDESDEPAPKKRGRPRKVVVEEPVEGGES